MIKSVFKNPDQAFNVGEIGAYGRLLSIRVGSNSKRDRVDLRYESGTVLSIYDPDELVWEPSVGIAGAMSTLEMLEDWRKSSYTNRYLGTSKVVPNYKVVAETTKRPEVGITVPTLVWYIAEGDLSDIEPLPVSVVALENYTWERISYGV